MTTKPPKIVDSRAEWVFPPERLETVESMVVAIPHKLPNLNDVIRLKGGRYAGAWNKVKVAFERAIRLAWVLDGINRGKAHRIIGPYRVSYTLLCKDRRSDPSNLFAGAEKVILDALVGCGALEGDGYKLHKGSAFVAQDSDKWGVIVAIESV